MKKFLKFKIILFSIVIITLSMSAKVFANAENVNGIESDNISQETEISRDELIIKKQMQVVAEMQEIIKLREIKQNEVRNTIPNIIIPYVEDINNTRVDQVTEKANNADYGIAPIKTEEIEVFKWEEDVDTSIGQITISDNGKVVKMTGNQTDEGKNALYIIPEFAQEQILTFDYNVEFGDSFKAAGIILKVKKTNNQLHGYMLSFNNPSQEYYSESNNNLGALWKFTYNLGTNKTPDIQKTLVKELNIPQSGSVKVTSDQEGITITGNSPSTQIPETKIAVDPEDQEFGCGYGFFTAHYSHNCERIGSFDLTNFGLVTVNILPHKLIIDPNGGTYNGSADKTTEEGVLDDVKEISVPQREGYTFAGWTKTGNGGVMSTANGKDIYTFGEEEEDDTITAQWARVDVSKKCDVEAEKVIQDQEITWTITATNLGTVVGNAVIKDKIPEGTTFVENSIKVNGDTNSYNQENLENGIEVRVEIGGSTELSFKTKVNDLDDKTIIPNIAYLTDKTVKTSPVEKTTNEVEVTYIEPIITENKEIKTENGKEYVVQGEKITFSINVKNDGGLEKEVNIKDKIPEGTTFVEKSVKLNGQDCYKIDETPITQEDLENGIMVNVPAYGETQVISFDVTVNDNEDKDMISNIATVDDRETNEVSTKYVEPIITENQEMKTENEKEYVVQGEKITYFINVKNDGGLDKEVNIKDKIPEGTTFVEESIKLNGKKLEQKSKIDLEEKDLENGIIVNVPAYGETQVISFDVTVNDNEDEDIISNIATVDDRETNEVSIKYVEPIIIAKKSAETQYEQNYVAADEKITYYITVENEGSLEKEVVIKDKIPEGTTFVNDSIKINDKKVKNEDGKFYTIEDLTKNGIKVVVPEKYLPGKIVLSFEVTVNTLEKDTDILKITNIATVDDKETNEVEHEALPFNMKIEETINEMYAGESLKEVKDNKTGKIEIESKKLPNTNVKIEYKIVVTNTGKIEGTATVKDTIPAGYQVATDNPTYWNLTSDGKLETTTEVLKPGESKELKVVLNWNNSAENVGEKENIVEISETQNISNAKETNLKDNYSDSSVIVAIKTGINSEWTMLAIVIIICNIIFVSGVIAIKKYVISDYV